MKYIILNSASYDLAGDAVCEFANGKKLIIEWTAGKTCGRPFYIRDARGIPMWSEELHETLSASELKELAAVLNSSKLYCSEDDYLEV